MIINQLFNYLVDYSKILIFTLAIFFWDLGLENIDTRLFIFLLLLYIFDYKILISKPYKKTILYCFLVFVILCIHYYFNLIIDKDNYFFISKNLIYIFFSFLVILLNLEFLRKNLRWIIFSFVLIFLTFTAIFFFINGYDQEFDLSCTYTGGWHGYTRYLFSENSHFGMISVAVVLYYSIGVELKNISLPEKFCFFIFLIVAVINYSALFLVAIILSLIALIISNFKEYKLQSIFFSFILMVTSLYFVFSDFDCRYKIFQPQSAVIQTFTKDFVKEENKNPIEKKDDLRLGMSGAVFVNSINIAKTSIMDRPFGWGLDRYEFAYNKYAVKEREKYRLQSYHDRLFDWNLNSKDGSNNLAKIITEFGFFSIFLFVFFVYFSFSKKATLEEKSFLIPLILTQLLRGAGYYNGGFLLCIILMLFISFLKRYD